MKTKKLLLTAVASLGLAAVTMAQVPNYLPTSGLVAYYPFTGNANDISGNGNNATVNGPTLTTDRFGNANGAYLFSGSLQNILTTIIQNNINANSVSLWFKTSTGGFMFQGSRGCSSGLGTRLILNLPVFASTTAYEVLYGADGPGYTDHTTTNNTYNDNSWHNAVGVWDGTQSATVNQNDFKIYIDGILVSQTTANSGGHPNVPISGSSPVMFGKDCCDISNSSYVGTLDDIGIWNRVLTSQEISNLYNGINNPCLVTVTDTLIINANLTGFNPLTYQNTIKLYPNPTNDHITIDYGNYSTLTGYTLKITNSLSQTVFTTAINQQTSYVSLSTWTGNGLYFVYTIDAQGNTVDVKKIVIQ